MVSPLSMRSASGGGRDLAVVAGGEPAEQGDVGGALQQADGTVAEGYVGPGGVG